MTAKRIALIAFAVATPVAAEETRQMDAHVHGVSTLQLAVEGGRVEVGLTSPGMDIVGFEYAASTEADKDAVAEAIRTMQVPENILSLPGAAECQLTEATAGLEADEDMDHAEHEDHDHDHSHDHDHEAHGDHGDEKTDGHTEFQARYVFDCANPEDLTRIGLPFFARFPNAQEIEAEYVTEAGAGAVEIGRDTAELILN